MIFIANTLLFHFSLVRVSFHYLTIMRTSASTSTCSYLQTMHVTRHTAVVDSIECKTGTRRDQLKNTRLPPQNSSWAFATLILPKASLSHPNRTRRRRSPPESVSVGRCPPEMGQNSGTINMLLTNEQRDGLWGAYFTCFRVCLFFRKTNPGIPVFGCCPFHHMTN